MYKCLLCNINETNTAPAVCDQCRNKHYPSEPELELEQKMTVSPFTIRPSINVREELGKIRDTINRILMIGV